MEPRKIIVVNESLTTCNEIMSVAVTVADLKAEIVRAGIDCGGKSLVEGRSHTKLEDDSQLLPLTVLYKGQPTNELSVMLMTPSKKISSGSERTDLIAEIKRLNLQEMVKSTFGRNFTQVSSSGLQELISGYSSNKGVIGKAPQNKEVDLKKVPVVPECSCNPAPKAVDGNCREALMQLLDLLEDEEIIGEKAKERVLVILGEETEARETKAYEPHLMNLIKDDFSWMKK